ncbi:TonB-dependent receptor [Aurantibacter crassamenti]|uniref:TonB-dependent receptor family protein n=1 Tax=Aurantibacter crassamenti TaxID=1837375 RepID=UPI0019398424|nr:TonB-dependent receptor [Aurantibacter crassamenti]MBM1104883.1 TonB-dependent receptor [Aurantibacter crassamenti]
MKYFLLFCLCTIQFLHAQDPVQIDSITQLDEVILLDGLKTKNTTGITQSEILGAKIFQNYSPIDMVSAINQLSGIFVFSGALNTNRITIRGIGARTLFGTNKLRMYYNDIPITNGSGSSELEAFDLENLSQIEIIKGPKGTAFGSNLGGAIILNPKQAIGKSTSFVNNFTIGSYNLIKNNLSFNHFDGKFRLGLQYGHTETDGYRDNNNFERDGLLLNTSYLINEKNKISLLINHVDYSAQIPSSLGATAFAENPKQVTYTWRVSQGYEANNYTLLGLNYEHKFSDKLKNSTSVFYNYLDHYEPAPFGILDEFTNGYGLRTRFIGKLNFSNISAEYTFGGELLKDEYNWNQFENLYENNNGNGSLQGDQYAANKEFRRQFNGFGTLLLPFSEVFYAQLGLNINKTNYDYRDQFNTGVNNRSAKRSFKTILLPSLDLNYKFSEDYNLYGNISRGFSNPSLEETLTPDGVINPDISQETGTNIELGSQLYFDNKNLSINIALYQMNIENLLVAERVIDDQYIGKNAGKTKHQGLELALNYRINVSSKIQMTPFLNYTYNHHKFVEFIDEGEDFSGNDLTGVPKNTLTSGLQMQLFDNFYWNTTYQYLGSVPLTDANTLSSDSFNIMNTRIGYQKKISNKFTLGLDLGINNVFDTVYAQSVLINTQGFGGSEPRYYYPGNGINYYSSVKLGYRL